MTVVNDLGGDLLFVYGTLRRGSGHAMALWLAAQADWLGPASCPSARLYRVGWYPALVPGAGPGEQVAGDLFRLRDPAAAWPRLDEFEGIAGGDDEYERRASTVTDSTGTERRAWVYWCRRPVDGLPRIASGDWLASQEGGLPR